MDEALWNDLDDYVSAFERAYQQTGSAAIEAFLPPTDHTLYGPVLRELVRVDLEYGWSRGRPQSLAEYQARFPALRNDAKALEAIRYENNRLRRLDVGSLAGTEPEAGKRSTCKSGGSPPDKGSS